MRLKAALLTMLCLMAFAASGAPFANIYPLEKMERGRVSGERFIIRANNYRTIFHGQLIAKEIQTKEDSLYAEWDVTAYVCSECLFNKLSKISLQVKDPMLGKKLQRIKDNQYEEFGDIVLLENARFTLFGNQFEKSYDAKCWAETHYYFSHDLKKFVNGFSLTCDRYLAGLHVYGQAVFKP